MCKSAIAGNNPIFKKVPQIITPSLLSQTLLHLFIYFPDGSALKSTLGFSHKFCAQSAPIMDSAQSRAALVKLCLSKILSKTFLHTTSHLKMHYNLNFLGTLHCCIITPIAPPKIHL